MIVGCYTLDLYCDSYDGGPPFRDSVVHKYQEFPHQYTGETRFECIKQARKDGWLISKKHQLCSKCSRKGAENGEANDRTDHRL